MCGLKLHDVCFFLPTIYCTSNHDICKIYVYIPIKVVFHCLSLKLCVACSMHNPTFRYNHENLLPLLGYADSGTYRCIVYAFMSNGSLEERLAVPVRMSRKKLITLIYSQTLLIRVLYSVCLTIRTQFLVTSSIIFYLQ